MRHFLHDSDPIAVRGGIARGRERGVRLFLVLRPKLFVETEKAGGRSVEHQEEFGAGPRAPHVVKSHLLVEVRPRVRDNAVVQAYEEHVVPFPALRGVDRVEVDLPDVISDEKYLHGVEEIVIPRHDTCILIRNFVGQDDFVDFLPVVVEMIYLYELHGSEVPFEISRRVAPGQNRGGLARKTPLYLVQRLQDAGARPEVHRQTVRVNVAEEVLVPVDVHIGRVAKLVNILLVVARHVDDALVVVHLFYYVVLDVVDVLDLVDKYVREMRGKVYFGQVLVDEELVVVGRVYEVDVSVDESVLVAQLEAETVDGADVVDLDLFPEIVHAFVREGHDAYFFRCDGLVQQEVHPVDYGGGLPGSGTGGDQHVLADVFCYDFFLFRGCV